MRKKGINQRGTYSIVNEKGKVIEKCRLYSTAKYRLPYLREVHGNNLKVVKNEE